MLSFEDSKGYLKNGGLRADDGTVLTVNGMYLSTSALIAVADPQCYISTLVVFADPTQIMFTLCVSRLANLTIWPGSWSSYMRRTITNFLLSRSV